MLVAEFVGTFMLVFTVGCNVLGKTPVWAGVSIACVLMVAIYALGNVSGANFNPAVSVSLAITTSMGGPGGMSWTTCLSYCGVQILAGITASLCYCVLFWNGFRLAPSKGFGIVSAGLCETLYTFMLCFVVLNVAVARKWSEGRGNPSGEGVRGNHWYGLAIGFVIVAGAYGAGIVSGGCFNPAVAIAIDTSSAGLSFGWCLVYTLFELLGAALAAGAFKLVRPYDFISGMSGATPQPSLQSKLISEFLGTFMLVLTVGLNVLGNSPAGAFSIAASLMCMIYALGDVSGAHFNPAVTLAILASRVDEAQPAKEVVLYMITQISAGIVAALTYTLIYQGDTFPLGPLPGFRWSQVAVAEIIFTFVLCYIVLCTAVSTKTKSESMFGLAIGMCVTVGGFAIGSISGGSLNPAVSIAIASSQIMNGGMFYKALIYSSFEFFGGLVAAAVAMATHGQNGK
jgi:aquaporin Z